MARNELSLTKQVVKEQYEELMHLTNAIPAVARGV